MNGKSCTTPHLFGHWENIARRIRRKKRLAIFLDFDGTLVRIAPKPDDVHLPDETFEILRKLARHRGVTLAVISGRQRAELQRYVGIPGINCMGLYGWESDAKKRMPFPVRLVLARTLVNLLTELPAYPGIWIEPKRNSFSIHVKGASADIQLQIRRQVKDRIKPLREILKVMSNLRDIEVAPVLIGDKGTAVRKFLGQPALRKALAIYFGDDYSDEPAFAAAKKGISVLVGKRRRTHARFCLRGPAEVTMALGRMEEMIR